MMNVFRLVLYSSAIVVAMSLSACQPDKEMVYRDVSVDSSLSAQVNSILAAENVYREGLGQTALSAGLSCTLYTVTGGDRIQSSISGHNTLTGITQVATFLLKKEFNQPESSVNDGMNVLPPALRSVYQNLYLLRCQGQIVVTQTGYVSFETLTDDGSVLYVDGVKIVDNDNNHGIADVSGTRYLRLGVHSFRLDYAQTGSGNQALIVKANGTVLDSMFFAH